MAENLLKVTYILEGLQQAEHLRMSNMYRLQSAKISDLSDSALLEPRLGALGLLAFPKTKITFEREEISDHRWNLGKYDRATDGNSQKGFCRLFWTEEQMLGGLCESQGAYLEGNWGISVLCTMFLVSCIFFSKCLYFSYYMDVYFLDRPRLAGSDTSHDYWSLSLLLWLEFLLFFSWGFPIPSF